MSRTLDENLDSSDFTFKTELSLTGNGTVKYQWLSADQSELLALRIARSDDQNLELTVTKADQSASEWTYTTSTPLISMPHWVKLVWSGSWGLFDLLLNDYSVINGPRSIQESFSLASPPPVEE